MPDISSAFQFPGALHFYWSLGLLTAGNKPSLEVQ